MNFFQFQIRIAFGFVLLCLFSACALDQPSQNIPAQQGSSWTITDEQGNAVMPETASIVQPLEIDLKNGQKVTFFVELATNDVEREKGLMFRESMPMDHGMLFIFEKSENLSFWMKNTLIPLDMIFADEKGKIVYIKKSALPCKTDPCESYQSSMPARYVLEINGGLSHTLGIQEGDTLGNL